MMSHPPDEDAATLAGEGSAGRSRPDPIDTTSVGPIPAPWRRSAPHGTSSVAAGRISSAAPTIRDRVLAFIRDRGQAGATDEEGEAALRIKPQTYTPRRRELVQLGLVGDSGRRRRTDAGRPAAVWVATSASGWDRTG